MIIVADSGSTKCHWLIFNNSKKTILECNTIGFNPFFVDQKTILAHLEESALVEYKNDIKKIFFYGAGCSSKEQNTIIENALKIFFSNAVINVKHDIEGACYSVYNGNKNITCILGTGSNSCLYDGEKITEYAPALGFILGDEASGNYFGKKILSYYFNKKLPQELRETLKADFETDLSKIKHNTYNKSRANKFLASFFPFIINNKNHPFIKKLINSVLSEFFSLHIQCYENHKNIEINFIGSVAYYLKEEIQNIAAQKKLNIGNIIQHPIYNLMDFHLKNEK
tara:strand:- start:75 stop:923 length:849 start_codon:yes stop_codon:yes gene_type:complete